MSTASQPLVIPRAGVASLLRDYATLTKARVTTLIVMTAWAGAYFAAAKSAFRRCHGRCCTLSLASV